MSYLYKDKEKKQFPRTKFQETNSGLKPQLNDNSLNSNTQKLIPHQSNDNSLNSSTQKLIPQQLND